MYAFCLDEELIGPIKSRTHLLKAQLQVVFGEASHLIILVVPFLATIKAPRILPNILEKDGPIVIKMYNFVGGPYINKAPSTQFIMACFQDSMGLIFTKTKKPNNKI